MIMQVRKGGIFTNIDPSEYGIYQRRGFEKVVGNPQPKVEEPVKPIEEPTVEVEEVAEEVAEPIDEVVVPKPKKKKTV